MTQPNSNNSYSVATGANSNSAQIIFFDSVDPTPQNIQFPVQKRWLNTTTDTEWVLIGFLTTNGVITADWRKLTSGTGPLELLQGDTGGPVPPNAGDTIFVLGDSTTGVSTAGNPGTNTLTISASPPIVNTTTTVGNVTQNLLTFTLGATPATYKFTIDISAFEASTPSGLGYTLQAALRTDGATGTVISVPDADEDEDSVLIADADWDITATGNSLVVDVTGVTGLTLNWAGQASYVKAQ